MGAADHLNSLARLEGSFLRAVVFQDHGPAVFIHSFYNFRDDFFRHRGEFVGGILEDIADAWGVVDRPPGAILWKADKQISGEQGECIGRVIFSA